MVFKNLHSLVGFERLDEQKRGEKCLEKEFKKGLWPVERHFFVHR